MGKITDKLGFLKLGWLKWTLFSIIALVVVIFAPWLVQFILNALFLITSFVVFTIIYMIIEMIKGMRE